MPREHPRAKRTQTRGACARAAACLMRCCASWHGLTPGAGVCCIGRSASIEDGKLAHCTVIRCAVSWEALRPLLRGAAALPIGQAPENFCYSNATTTVMLSVDSVAVTILLYCSAPTNPTGLGRPISLAAKDWKPQLLDVTDDDVLPSV